MNLTKIQREFLQDRSKAPIAMPSHMPGWMHKLWIEEMIDVVGRSIYISDKGFSALAEDGGQKG